MYPCFSIHNLSTCIREIIYVVRQQSDPRFLSRLRLKDIRK